MNIRIAMTDTEIAACYPVMWGASAAHRRPISFRVRGLEVKKSQVIGWLFCAGVMQLRDFELGKGNFSPILVPNGKTHKLFGGRDVPWQEYALVDFV